MIERMGKDYILVCDICGEDAGITFDEFHQAVRHKEIYRWKSRKRNGEWEDVCPECRRIGSGD